MTGKRQKKKFSKIKRMYKYKYLGVDPAEYVDKEANEGGKLN